MSKTSAKNILYSMAVGADQSCQLFRQIVWFLRNNGGQITLSKLNIEFCFTWLELPNYKKKNSP